MASVSNRGISSIELLGQDDSVLPEYLRRERQQAIQNLLAANSFQPHNDNNGPYDIILSIEESRLLIRMRNAAASDLSMLVLSLKPYRRVIQDYFLMLESYEKARLFEGREKLEAIDMGRRGIHNEGADLLLQRLGDKIDMDHETARKLFTLICTLHKTNIRLAGA